MPSKVFLGEHKREDRDPADLRSGTKTEVSLSEQKQFMETVAGKLVLGYGLMSVTQNVEHMERLGGSRSGPPTRMRSMRTR